MSLFTQEQLDRASPNGKILAEILEAKHEGNYEKARLLRQQLEIPAEGLMAAKISMGADWIKKRNLRTETAEVKYGKDWLDR